MPKITKPQKLRPHPDWKPRPQKPPEERKPTLLFKPAGDIEQTEVQWLWYPYVPAGKLTLLEGDPGLGKSWIICDMAAKLSQGEPLPGVAQGLRPQKVLMMSAEDGLDDTVAPRLQKLGANMENVLVSDNVLVMDEAGVFEIEQAMKTFAAAVLFIDPLVGYLGAKMDMHRANEVRQVMAALAAAGRRSGCAVIAVRHLRKAKGGKEIYQGIGSIDFTAAARSVLQVAESKAGTRYVRHVKSNLAPAGRALAYELKKDRFGWLGVFEDREFEKGSKPGDKAGRFLREILANGPVPAQQLLDAAKAKGLNLNTLNRAKKGLAESYKTQTGWLWQLIDWRTAGEGTKRVQQPLPEPIPKAAQGPVVDPSILAQARARRRHR